MRGVVKKVVKDDASKYKQESKLCGRKKLIVYWKACSTEIQHLSQRDLVLFQPSLE